MYYFPYMHGNLRVSSGKFLNLDIVPCMCGHLKIKSEQFVRAQKSGPVRQIVCNEPRSHVHITTHANQSLGDHDLMNSAA